VITIEAPPIRRQGLFIPGGWQARIPGVTFYPGDLAPLYAHFQKRGHNFAVATQQAEGALEAIWIRAYLDGMREAITNAALRYDAIYPELELAGFDPEKVQAAYVPGDKFTGRRGKVGLKKLLVEMGQEEQRRRAG